jgi:hypothetical protein
MEYYELTTDRFKRIRISFPATNKPLEGCKIRLHVEA